MAASKGKHNNLEKQIVLMFLVIDDWYEVILGVSVVIVGVAAAKQQYQAVKVFKKNMQSEDI